MCRAGRSSRPGWKCAARRCELGGSWGRHGRTASLRGSVDQCGPWLLRQRLRAVGVSISDPVQSEHETADVILGSCRWAPHRHGGRCSGDWSVVAHAWDDTELRERLDEALIPPCS